MRLGRPTVVRSPLTLPRPDGTWTGCAAAFPLTRVAEVAIHGLDMADALGREPWLTVESGAAVPALLLGPDQVDAARELT
jgi:hypothetical protein